MTLWILTTSQCPQPTRPKKLILVLTPTGLRHGAVIADAACVWRRRHFEAANCQYNAGRTDLGGTEPVISAGVLFSTGRDRALLNFFCLELA